MTEVILRTKVEGLGAEADVVRVKPGYARNYLIPQGLAMPATLTFKQQIEKLKKVRAEREAQELNEANDLAKRLNKMTITFQMSAAEGSEKVFGSVTAHDILERLAKEKVIFDRKKLKLVHPLKELGEHRLEVVLHPEINATFKVVLETSQTVSDIEEKQTSKSKEGLKKLTKQKTFAGTKKKKNVSDTE